MPPRRDLIVGAVAALLGTALAVAEGMDARGAISTVVLGAALGLVRVRPRTAWAIAVVALVVIAFSRVDSLGVTVLAAGHAVCVTRREPRWPGVAGALALLGAALLSVATSHSAGVPTILVIGAAWAVGVALRERDLIEASLAERARELEEEREAHAALSVRYERARIAAELHDIVAHAISVMVVQAAAGQRLARDPELTAETFDAIAGAARQAEDDMGRLAALLGEDGALAAAPDLALVEQLVARAAGSGLSVTLRLEGEREGLPASAVDAVCHVVQEGLTNALRYAAGADVDVLVRGERDALVVMVDNGNALHDPVLAGVGTGTGLQGLRERVGAAGGALEAGPAPGGGWRLAARLPRRVAVAVAV